MKVIVVGGGAVGLCVAYFLRRAGVEVLVAERGHCGHGASFGNAGYITRFHGPLPAPGIIRDALRWTIKGGSPLRIRPRLDPAFGEWLWRFVKVSRNGTYGERAHALLALNRRTFDLYDAFRGNGVHFPSPTSGLILACLSLRELDHQVEALADLRQAGYDDPVEILDRDGVRDAEPALSDRVAGALFVPADRCLRPELFTAALVAWLRQNAVEILEDTEVVGLRRTAGCWRAETQSESLSADAIVVGAGIASRKLLSPLGVRLPLEAGKGYSLIAMGRGTPPQRAVGLMDAKVAYTPFGESARLASFLELGAVDASVPEARLDEIVRRAAPYFRDWRPERRLQSWAGFRPMTPDGLPFIGGLPGCEQLYVAAGHGTLGLTLAPATGEALAQLVASDTLPDVLIPFRPDRTLG
jgi:D-amino-acid dehydrogenase